MAERVPEGIEIGIHLLARNSDSGVMVLFGGSTPGGLGDFDDIAEVGSIFITTDGRLLQKNLNNGNNTDWERKADRSEIYDIAEINTLLAPKINYSDLVANIITNNDNVPLSASQGVVLQTNLTNAIVALKGGVSTSNDTLKKIEDNANAFRSRTDNPHIVTKSQVGLGVVENKTSQDIRNEIVDVDIPATIARDGEVVTAVNNGIALLRDTVPVDGDTLNKLNDKILSILTTLQSDTTALDTLQEVVDFIGANKVTIDSVLLNKVAYTDIIDNLLSSDGVAKVLSANQGRILKILVDARMIGSANLSELTNIITARANLGVYSTTQVDSAIATATLNASQIKTLYESNLNTNEFSDIEKSKLGGVQNNATQNSVDAFLLARANHTGTQLASTISNLIATITSHTDVALNTTHRGLTNNPHAVTKAQVGLGNVTNDAQLKIASNLSDVANILTSRDNLNIYHLHRLIEFTNLDIITDFNLAVGVFNQTPIFGTLGRTHLDFTKISAFQVRANFIGRIRVTCNLSFSNIIEKFMIENKVAISGILSPFSFYALSEQQAGNPLAQTFFQDEFDVINGSLVGLVHKSVGKVIGATFMSAIGSNFIKIERVG